MTAYNSAPDMDIIGRCNDGSDDSLVSERHAESAVLKGIGSLTAINPVAIHLALCQSEDSQSFQFSRSWLAPRLVLHLASGQMTHCSLSLLIADNAVTCEDILISLAVLRHLRIDSKMMLENNCYTFNGNNCIDVENPRIKLSHVGRLMVARAMGVKGKVYDHGVDSKQR